MLGSESHNKYCFKCISESARKVSLCLQEIDPAKDCSFISYGQDFNQYIGSSSAYHSLRGLQCGVAGFGGSPECSLRRWFSLLGLMFPIKLPQIQMVQTERDIPVAARPLCGFMWMGITVEGPHGREMVRIKTLTPSRNNNKMQRSRSRKRRRRKNSIEV